MGLYNKTSGIDKPTHQARCRHCGEGIKRGHSGFAIRNVYVSPKHVDLWFHIECMADMTSELHCIK
jgi:hypothetical protein